MQSDRSVPSEGIPIRHPAHSLSEDIPRHWRGGDSFARHFLNALSSTFPFGEIFFVRSVLHDRDRIDDPELLARQLLSDPERRTDDMHPEMGRLWCWHALEEAEHKAVAFDVLARVAPDHAMRCFAMASMTLGMAIEVFDRMSYMLWKDGLLLDRRTWSNGWKFLFGTDGFLHGLGRDYRAWYRPDFHPNDVEDHELIANNQPAVEAGIMA